MFRARRQTESDWFQSFAFLSGTYTTAKKLGCRYCSRSRAIVCAVCSGSSARMREISSACALTNSGDRYTTRTNARVSSPAYSATFRVHCFSAFPYSPSRSGSGKGSVRHAEKARSRAPKENRGRPRERSI